MRHEAFITPSFTRHTLGVAISTVLLAALNTASANGLVAVDGPMGTALVGGDAAVPVIDIVAPNAQGLSHNRWQDYNVGASGLVLNNSVAAGQAQIGQRKIDVGANAQFDNRAANTILNEVVGVRGSSINGEQVIFGEDADYVLSNPNGILLNNARMAIGQVHTASFVVGIPVVEAGQITAYDTRASTSAERRLIVGNAGLDISAGSLQLIAPTMIKVGHINAGGDMTVLLGNHLADARTLATQSVVHSPAPVDASLLGAMHAKRIKIVSTDQGVGLNMGISQLRGSHGIDIASAGALSISSSKVIDGQHAPVGIDAGDHDLVLSAGGDMTLTSVAINGQNIDARAAGRLKLDALTNQTETQRQASADEHWFTLADGNSSAQITERTLTHVGNRLTAARKVRLDGRQGIEIAATRIDGPEDVSMYTVWDGVTLGAKVDKQWRTVRVAAHDRPEDSASTYIETAQASRIDGGSVSLQGTGIVGATINATRSISLGGEGTKHIGALELKRTLTQGSGARRVTLSDARAHEASHEHTYQLPTRIKATNGTVSVYGTDISIIGSQLSAKTIRLNSNGTLSIEGASEAMSIEGARPSADQKHKGFDRTTLVNLPSVVIASDALTLQAQRSTFRDGTVSMAGSLLNAGSALTIKAQDHVWVSSAAQKESFNLSGSEWGPRAGEVERSGSWNRKGFRESQARSTLGAGSMHITADGMLNIAGSLLDSTRDITLKASDMQLTASLEPTGPRNETVWLDNDLPGYYFSPAYDEGHARVTDRIHNGFSMKAGGDIDISATRLATHAASVNAAGRLMVPGGLALFKDTPVEDGDAIRKNYHGYIAPRQPSWQALASLPLAALDAAPPSSNGTTRSSAFVAGTVDADTAQRMKDLNIPLTLR